MSHIYIIYFNFWPMEDIPICVKFTGWQLLLIGNGDYQILLIQTVHVFSLYTGSVKIKLCMDLCRMWNGTQLNRFMLLHGLPVFCKKLQKIFTVMNNSFQTFIINLHKTGWFVLVLHHTQKPFCSVTITGQCIPAPSVLGFLNPVYRHLVVLLG